MHDLLRERIVRKLEVLPEQQLYQVLDYIEFLEKKYAADAARQPDSLQRFAERLEDGMRVRNVGPKVISGTVGLIGSARKVMKTVSDTAKTASDMVSETAKTVGETAKSVTDTASEILAPTPPKPPAPGSDSGPAATKTGS